MESHMNLVRRNVDELRESLPRSISEPVFLVLDPVGRAITIQLSHCHNFDDLDRILKAYLHGRPQAGSSYVERGDYNIVSSDGTIIPPRKVPGKLRAGVRFGMSIVQRMRRLESVVYTDSTHARMSED
ncbi:hypothetical protein K438DRAFT_99832 [Mycena galopus ATCC 62051]|nr:hypothetical protein K438DRAFT_99832 [Mycena galopus ATCC 62051]